MSIYRVGKFLHITFVWSFFPRTDVLEKVVFPTSKDWMRYAPNCWIVYTYVDASEWFRRIKPHVSDRDKFLICELNVEDKQGWMDKWVWEWLNKEREGDGTREMIP